MPLSRRYDPEWAPAEKSVIGMDFSYVIPPGVGIASGLLTIATNKSSPQDASADWEGPTNGTPQSFVATVQGRTVYAQMSGGLSGQDYRFTWTVIDTDGNEFARTALLLCAPTS